MRKVGIIGASGFTGHELVKILKKHKKVKLVVINSKTYAGKKIKSLYKTYKGKETYDNFSVDELNLMNLDCIFLCVPHKEALKIVPKLKAKKIIDLSADYRFKNIKTYESVYKTKFPKKSNKAIYGLPELNKSKIKSAKLIANPGCYPTASLLATLPIDKLAKYIVIDAKSGWSGAGKQSPFAKDSKLLENNIIPYNLTAHRHLPEIEQFLKTKISFTPHVIDTFQGLMATTHILLKKKTSKKATIKKFENYYKNDPFVKIIKNKIPEIKDVTNTNYCHIGGFEIDDNNQLVIIAVIDNLLKGASGQAVQNMNLALGFKETEGLS